MEGERVIDTKEAPAEEEAAAAAAAPAEEDGEEEETEEAATAAAWDSVIAAKIGRARRRVKRGGALPYGLRAG